MPLRRKIDTVTPLSKKWTRASSIVKSKMRKIMEDAGELVAKESMLRAPVMDGNLEASHGSKVTRSNNDQITVEVFVGGTVNGVNVDAYLMEMHESHGIRYQPGQGTINKQAANPSIRVGRKFLERALADTEDEIFKKLEEALMGEIS